MADPTSPPGSPAPPSRLPAVVAQPGFPPAAGGDYYPSQDERTMGMLIHLLAILAGLIGPLILWLVKREGSPFIDHNGKEAVNFQISFLIYYLFLVLGGAALTILTKGTGLVVVVPLAIALPIVALVLEILCCVKANRGQWPRYPLAIRFIK